MDKQQILREAKKIMDSFVSALEKVKVKEHLGVKRDSQTRVASKEKCETSDFKKRMLKNAPKVKDDLLIMEKKEW